MEDETAQYPWEDVERARRDWRLQRQHPPAEAESLRAMAKPCPQCGRDARELAWFYFDTPEWAWANLCGSAGWMTVCDPCRRQVDFFSERLS